MKRTISRSLIAGTAALVTMTSLAVAAWPGKLGGERGHNHGQVVERMARHLDLSDEQQVQVEQLFANGLEEVRADRERIEELRENLLGQAASFDAGDAQAAADEIGAITSRMVYRRASMQASLYQLLDEEQRAQLAAFNARRDKRREHFREHGPRHMW